MSETRSISLTELPLDIILLIVPYLDAPSFLSFCSTCKAFQDPAVRVDAGYWRHVTRATFRVPNHPIIQADGQRWQRLYKRMLTQTRVFTWGSNTNGCLGHSAQPIEDSRPRVPLRARRVPIRPRVHNSNASIPVEMENTRDLGIIADLQCGGWSTTLLTSKGVLYFVGIIDGTSLGSLSNGSLGPLRYPEGPQAVDSDDPAVTIRQFSAGRSHILGLSDSGRIWLWKQRSFVAEHVTFTDLRILDSRDPTSFADPEASPGGRVRQVVAGWSTSSVYVTGLGILLWKPHEGNQYPARTYPITNRVFVPKTNYQRPKGNARDPDDAARALGENVGEVVNYIVLEHFVVFVTDIGKFFAVRINWDDAAVVGDIVELEALRDDSGGKSNKVDVQGSFRSFAAFRNGEVITSNQDYLSACLIARQESSLADLSTIPGLRRIPALQHSGVISVAFGDYHFHVLHNNGRITSYGTEPRCCGALGLGGEGDPEGRTRGIRYGGQGLDGRLVPHAYTHGRTVWFEPVKKQWIRFLTSGGKDPDEAKERMRMAVTDQNVQGEVSEWFEQQGTDWDKHPSLQQYDEDGLGAYFALSVAAAGWHSGALVLVNEELAKKVEERCIVKVQPQQKHQQEPGSSEEPTPEAADSGANTTNAEGVSRLENIVLWVNSWARWYLGLPDTANNGHVQTQAPPRPPNDATADHFTHPENHGASPGPGLKYIWADVSFPRLRLSNGTEMPGQVEFSEWKYGRPEWKLDIEFP